MIVLGVTGSIAAYKAVDILRLLRKAGQDVRVLMTESATRFVGPLTFQALSGHPVVTDLLDPSGWEMVHLELAEKASALVVAPLSAETLSQLARGSAGNVITACALSVPCSSKGKPNVPVFLAPAMHDSMWAHPATQANVKTLRAFGYRFIGPERGALGRVGDEGLGRLCDPALIAKTVLESLKK